MTNGTAVKPKVMAAGLGGTLAAGVMAAVQGIWPDLNIPAGLEGLIAAAIAFILAWFKKE